LGYEFLIVCIKSNNKYKYGVSEFLMYLRTGSDVIADELDGFVRIYWDDRRSCYVNDRNIPLVTQGKGSDILVEVKYYPNGSGASIKRPKSLRKMGLDLEANAYSHINKDEHSRRIYYPLHFWRIFEHPEITESYAYESKSGSGTEESKVVNF